MEYIVLWILALFGLWTLISNMLDNFYIANKEKKFEIILNTYNQEDSIQFLVNQLSKLDMVGKIKIVDNNSTDDTVRIINELKKSNSKIIFENKKGL